MIDIQDDFLEDGMFNYISNFFQGHSIPWTFCDDIAGPKRNLDEVQFVHVFFNLSDPFLSSEFSHVINPIWEKLQPKYIIRAKANLRTKTSELVQSNWHVDIDIPSSVTSILYFNSNDGYTVFKHGQNVESVANRLVTFDSSLEHAGTSTTSTSARFLLNLNYIPS